MLLVTIVDVLVVTILNVLKMQCVCVKMKCCKSFTRRLCVVGVRYALQLVQEGLACCRVHSGIFKFDQAPASVDAWQ